MLMDFLKNEKGGDFDGTQITFPKILKIWLSDSSYW